MAERSSSAQEQPLSVPTLSLPKGGGAIRGIDEKFSVNALTGTASLSLPLPIAAARANFAPQLALSYDSGSGNSPFGLGWQLSLPAITRKTDKGLPQYRDAQESDTFMLAGAEDLVPALINAGGTWRKDSFARDGFNIQRYRPRIEGLFARIERWTDSANGQTHWRSVTKDNITNIYGQSCHARIANPADSTQVFQWLLEKSYDAKGNLILYRYKPEDGDNVDATLPQERNRTANANRYLKSIFYGNQTPRSSESHAPEDCHFQIVFDYGEHDRDNPTPEEAQRWPCRKDPFSTYRAGFEVRTYRLCQRVLLFHHFADEKELTGFPLVRATELAHEETAIASFLNSITQTGYLHRDGETGYRQKSLPSLEFQYTKAVVSDEVKTIDAASLENLPYGLDGARYQWVDLESEGLSGILTEQADAWFYKRNLGNARLAPEEVIPKLAPLQLVNERPSLADLSGGAQQLMSLANDGRLDLVQFAPPLSGYYERDEEGHWQPFRPFAFMPNLDWRNPNLKFIDLTGDGFPDLLISEDELFVWHPARAKAGFGPAEWVRKLHDEERGPALVFADSTQTVFVADMSGDGLPDLVRIRNGQVCYWPNLGYGRFGSKVTMDGAPYFDYPDQFNPNRIRLADIDGSGTTDIFYLGRDAVRFWFNQSGNSFSAPQQLAGFPQVDNLAVVTVVDLLGNGTQCLAWSSALAQDAQQPLRYVDLMSGQKPHLLHAVTNNLGAETRVQYAASTKFYLEDRAAGRPWITKLPFPVHVVERVESFDYVSQTKFVNTYAYRHGYYDGAEREFRGFGYVEQRDTESYSKYSGQGLFTETPQSAGEEFHLAPVVTKTWYHTGAYFSGAKISKQCADEYFNLDPHAVNLPDTLLPALATAQEEREACRALKGSILRQEIYAEDGTAKSASPYSVSERNYQLKLCQPLEQNRYAVFYVQPRETLDYHYERKLDDPRITHALTLAVDQFGNVLKAANIGYARRAPAFPEQARTLITYTENDFINRPNDQPTDPAWRLLGVPAETRTYEITGASFTGKVFTFQNLQDDLPGAAEILYEIAPTAGTVQKRLIERVRSRYLKDDLSGPLPFGQVESLALPYESYKQAFTPGLLANIYGTRVNPVLLTNEGRYVLQDAVWWIPAGRQLLETTHTPSDRNPFYLPIGVEDPFGNISRTSYDAYNLLPIQTTDPLGNAVKAENDYRVLQPRLLTDPNGNRSAVKFDELGMVVATAVMGKAGGGEGDTLDDPTTRLEYELSNWKNTYDPKKQNSGQPNFVHTFAREQHGTANPRWQESFTYSDGLGHEVLKKVQAEPGLAPQRDSSGALVHDTNGKLILSDTGSNVRWVGTGRTVFDNKGNAIKRYEPFFDSSPAYNTEKELVEWGVTPILRYDPLGRLTRTDNPNGTFSKVEFDAWQQTTYDENDTVPDSQWYKDRQNLPTNNQEGRAAKLAAAHANTPAIVHLDTLGRAFLTIADNGTAGKYETRVELDIEGNQRKVIDALERIVMRYDYDMLGNRIHQASMEAGERWMLSDVTGKPIRAWDSRDHQFRTTYDALRRPADSFLRTGTGAEQLVGRTVYGETRTNPEVNNLRGKAIQLFDQAGIVTSDDYDFKGNLLSSSRQIAVEYKATLDWSGTVPLEALTYTTSTRYDALNRPTELTAPDNSVIRPGYNEANLLEKIEANLRGAATVTAFVNNIDYDAKGQRERIEYGNGVSTAYSYDPLTFRLIHLQTVRGTEPLQDLRYTYDPVGNITHISDDAQQTIYFNGQVVLPQCDYAYDAIYRLIAATGREHLGQTGGQPNAPTAPDAFNGFHTRLGHPGDGKAMGRYVEQYVYDEVGNFLSMQHSGSDPANPGWSRAYTYNEASLIEPAKKSNRLSSTTISSGAPEAYPYDAHGNMTRMNHLPLIQWDYHDQLQATAQQVVNSGTPETTWYVYDSAGQRVRKVTDNSAAAGQTPTRKAERLYLGGFEIHREYGSNGSMVTLERQTLLIMDDKQRIALVETRTQGNDPAPQQLIRYQFGNHLGSASLELDDKAQIISYEEYTPYGSTSYQAVRSKTETPKRYRYTGKEQDEDSGLYYHGARYYTPWIGRWISTDPAGMVDGPNLFIYSKNAPVNFSDFHGTRATGVNEGPDPPLSPNKPIKEQQLTTVGDCGLIDLDTYDEDPPRQSDELPSYIEKVTGGCLTELNLKPEQFHSESGMDSGLYYNKNTGEYILAFRGTTGSIIQKDWRTNLKEESGGIPRQYKEAIELSQSVQKAIEQEAIKNKSVPGTLILTGHSLGGALADAGAISLGTGAPVVTFNSAGLNKRTMLYAYKQFFKAHNEAHKDEYVQPKSPIYAKPIILALYRQGEIVSKAQDHLPIPDAIGNRISLKSDKPIMKGASKHSQVSVIDAYVELGLEAKRLADVINLIKAQKHLSTYFWR